MTQEKINRINELARKQKSEGLTEEEKQEQYVLRRGFQALPFFEPCLLDVIY